MVDVRADMMTFDAKVRRFQREIRNIRSLLMKTGQNSNYWAYAAMHDAATKFATIFQNASGIWRPRNTKVTQFLSR
jgi:hypothetical protein